MSGFENTLNKLSTRIKRLENILKNEDKIRKENEVMNQDDVEKNLKGNLSVNMMGFQNVQKTKSKPILVQDETTAVVLWNPPETRYGDPFGGVHNENYMINIIGQNVYYEFVITVSWEKDNNGFRTVALESPDGLIYNASYIPDNMPVDSENTHKHHVVFKPNASKRGGWKVLLYQNSGKDIGAEVEIMTVGPIVI